MPWHNVDDQKEITRLVLHNMQTPPLSATALPVPLFHLVDALFRRTPEERPTAAEVQTFIRMHWKDVVGKLQRYGVPE